MTTYSHERKQLYRSRDGMICGVCRGLADYAEISAIWIRLPVVVAFLMSGFFPVVIVYVVAALIMRPEPVIQPMCDDDLEFYNSYTSSRSMALARLKRKFEQLERRTQRLESMVTAREYSWEHRLNTGQ